MNPSVLEAMRYLRSRYKATGGSTRLLVKDVLDTRMTPKEYEFWKLLDDAGVTVLDLKKEKKRGFRVEEDWL